MQRGKRRFQGGACALSRREFAKLAAAALGCGLAGCASQGLPSVGGRKWRKGMLHCHTYWSDGRGFPEDAASAYKSLGYGFLSITDHNRIGAGEWWREVKPEDGPWPPSVSRAIFEHYAATFSHARTRVAGGRTEVRMQPLDETISMFSEKGKFLVMPGEEITRKMNVPDGLRSRCLHMNVVNLPEATPATVGEYVGSIANRPGLSVQDVLAADFADYRALAAKYPATPSLFMLNHPHWASLDVVPADLASIPEMRFFEVCNCGVSIKMEGELVDDGWRNDRLWDMANALRVAAGMPLVYGVGSDDSHWYPGNGTAVKPGAPCTPGDAYVRVNAAELTPSAIFSAMLAGDFHASSGVEPDEVSFDGGTLRVSVPAKPGVAYTIRFIVTKRGCSLKPSKIVPLKFKDFRRMEGLPGEGVGVTAAVVRSAAGEALSASYSLKGDDLFVRARVESSEPAVVQQPFHPRMKCAWTQPYAHGGGLA